MGIRVSQGLSLDGRQVSNWQEMEAAYRRRIQTHGLGHESLFYPDEALHIAKLAHMSRVLYNEVKTGESVLDVGCGTGDLIPFLPPCHYRGIDLVSEFVAEAARRYPDLTFENMNLLNIDEQYDWVLLAGMMGSVPEPEILLQKAWGLAARGIIVDFIDSSKYHGYLNSYSLGACTEFLLRQGAQQVRIYPTPKHNWTFFVVCHQSLWL